MKMIDEGLLFSIPLSEGMFGFGQLIVWQEPIFYMIAYDLRSESLGIADEQELRPILMGNFFDVLIRNGRWQPIRQLPVPKVVFPCFKIKIGDRFYVESWDRERKREATPDDLDVLKPRTDYGPIILENALKAHFGLVPWEIMFEPLRVENVTMSSKRLTPQRREPSH
jgi:hypothetical protein